METPHPLIFTGAMLEADNLDEYGFERPWLSLNTEIPLEWLDPLLGGLRLTGADLQGRFDFSGSPLGADIVFGSEEEAMRASVKAEIEAFIGGLLSQDLGDILPEAMTAAQSRVMETSNALGLSSLKMSLAASASRDSITAESLSAEFVRSEGDSIFAARLLHPVSVDFGKEGPEF